MIVTDKRLREYYGHNGHECKVRISKLTGEVLRYGSPDPYNRSMDYWHYLGTTDECRNEVLRAEPGA